MERISKDVTAAHQVTLMFQDYDERRPKAIKTTDVLISLFNFLAALAGDNVRTGVISDLKAVYGRAEEFFVNTYLRASPKVVRHEIKMPKGIDLKEDVDMILLKLLDEEMYNHRKNGKIYI